MVDGPGAHEHAGSQLTKFLLSASTQRRGRKENLETRETRKNIDRIDRTVGKARVCRGFVQSTLP
jgi:hypothetical protein